MIYGEKMSVKKLKERLRDVLSGDAKPETFRKYDALRAYVFDDLSAKDAGEMIGFKANSFRTLVWKVGKEGLDAIEVGKRGPKERHKVGPYTDEIIELRKRGLNSDEISKTINEACDLDISSRTVTRVLKERGFKKLRRRSAEDRKKAKAVMLDELKRCRNDTGEHNGLIKSDNAGVFLFTPFINDLELMNAVKEADLHGTRDIQPQNYFLSFMALKLINARRLVDTENYQYDKGMGLFTGLNKLPSSASLHTYSYNFSIDTSKKLMKSYIRRVKRYIDGSTFNMDFHSIPFFGESEDVENNYVPMRGKAMKSVSTFLVQDQETTIFCYGDANVNEENKDDKILEFVSYWEDTTGKKPEYLIFDSGLTTYEKIHKLDEEMDVKFVTLRRRGKNLIAGVKKIPKGDWKRVHLKNVKRKYRNLRVADRTSKLRVTDKDGKVIANKWEVRELVITNNGRDKPSFMITNDCELSCKDVIEKYAPRWRIENGISEEVEFFSLNALSSTVVVKNDFDVALTQIANCLYKLMAKDILGFEKSKPRTLYEKFIKGSGEIEMSDDKIVVKLDSRKYTPLLRNADFVKKETLVPWLENRKLEFIWV